MDPNEPSRVVKVGMCLRSKLTKQLVNFLRKNEDVFAWRHADVVGIHPNVICHRLNINPQVELVRQKQRALDAHRYKALQDEVD